MGSRHYGKVGNENSRCVRRVLGTGPSNEVWQHESAKRHNDTGLRLFVGSTDCTSEFLFGVTLGCCLYEVELCERYLM